jgi:CheY-like chemotaxis protein
MTSTILVVDGEHDLATTCQRLLTRRGWSVTIANDRETALAMLARLRPRLAFVDRQLPDGDGLDVVRAAVAAGTPVILTSGQATALTRQQARAEGAAAFLAKPFSALELQDLVDRVAGAADPVAPLAQRPPAPGVPGQGIHC